MTNNRRITLSPEIPIPPSYRSRRIYAVQSGRATGPTIDKAAPGCSRVSDNSEFLLPSAYRRCRPRRPHRSGECSRCSPLWTRNGIAGRSRSLYRQSPDSDRHRLRTGAPLLPASRIVPRANGTRPVPQADRRAVVELHRSDRQPACFPVFPLKNVSPQSFGDLLSAETNAKHWLALADECADKLPLLLQPRQFIQDAHGTAQYHQEIRFLRFRQSFPQK